MIDNIFALRKGEILTLMLQDGSTIHAEFDGLSRNNWQLKMLPSLSRRLRGIERVVINFVRAQAMHSGAVNIIVLDEMRGSCIVSAPESLKKRPLRNESRIEVNLPVGIIRANMIAISQFSPFRPRSENLIINLTSKGALIACRFPMESEDDDLILLTCFEDEDPHNPDNQVYYRGKIRRATDRREEEFSFCYGMLFYPMLPDNRLRLDKYLEKLDDDYKSRLA